MFLDIAVGILGYGIFAASPTWLGYAVAVLLVLLPDVDMIATIFPRAHWLSRILHGHRGVTHYPILYLPIALVIGFVAGEFWGILSLSLFLWHFVHDTFFLGWGVVWGWPLCTKRIKCFPDKDGKILPIPLFTWSADQDANVRAQYGTHNWLRAYYMSLSWNAVIEYGALLSSLWYLFTHIN